MGLLGAVAGGVSAAAGAAADYYGKSALAEEVSRLEEEKAARLMDRGIAAKRTEAADERQRVSEFSKPVVNQPNGLLSQGAGLNDAGSVGADENVGRDVQKRERESTSRERQNRAMVAGDLPNAERFGKDADRTEDNALNARKLEGAEARQNAWNANEASKRENEAKRIEAIVAKIGATGKDKTPSRVAEAQQIMENINKDRVAAGKPTITFEDALTMHFRAADPAKETVTYQGNDPVPTERKVTRPVGSKDGEQRKVIPFGSLK